MRAQALRRTSPALQAWAGRRTSVNGRRRQPAPAAPAPAPAAAAVAAASRFGSCGQMPSPRPSTTSFPSVRAGWAGVSAAALLQPCCWGWVGAREALLAFPSTCAHSLRAFWCPPCRRVPTTPRSPLPPCPSGVLLGVVTLACLLLGFWWRRRLERQRQRRAAEQPPADVEQGRLPRCSLGERLVTGAGRCRGGRSSSNGYAAPLLPPKCCSACTCTAACLPPVEPSGPALPCPAPLAQYPAPSPQLAIIRLGGRCSLAACCIVCPPVHSPPATLLPACRCCRVGGGLPASPAQDPSAHRLPRQQPLLWLAAGGVPAGQHAQHPQHAERGRLQLRLL